MRIIVPAHLTTTRFSLQLSCFRRNLAQTGADTIDYRHDKQHGNHRYNPADPTRQRGSDSNPQSKRAEHKRTIALAEWTVVTPRRADRLPEYACEFREGGEKDQERNADHTEWLDHRNWGDKHGIRNDIANLIEIRAQTALLPVLACQHPVDGVESHAQDEPNRQQQEDPSRFCSRDDDHGDDGGADRCRQGNLVGGNASIGQSPYERLQQVLELRFQRIECHELASTNTADTTTTAAECWLP